MGHQVNVYYMYCPRGLCTKGAYHDYQRKLADKMLNYGLKSMFGVDGTEKTVEKGTYGKPYLKGMEQYRYNISNTDGMVVCAVSDICVGIDVERTKSFRKGILRKCSTESENAYILEAADKEQQEERFFRLWTLKESYIKMTGEGMRMPLKEAEFRFSEDGMISSSQEAEFYQKKQGNYWVSVCVPKEAEIEWIDMTQ